VALFRATLGRLGVASTVIGRDALRFALRRRPASPGSVADSALPSAIDWLCRTHDATGRQGSSKGFSLLHGWMPAYPETTGYVIGTLLDFARRHGDGGHVQRAREMGDWEVSVQEDDGGIMEGAVGTEPRRSIVFNTGQVLHGWVDLEEAGHEGYRDAAARAGRFLVDNMRDDGTWDPRVEYSGIPHAYNSRVSWAMARWAVLAGDDEVRDAAVRQLDWVVSMQLPNGWFDSNFFKPGMTPSTHAIAYTMRGLLESSAVLGEDRWLEAAAKAAGPLIRHLDSHRFLPANYDRDWRAEASYACLTGTAQVGGVLLRLHQLTGDDRFLPGGLQAVEQAAAYQERGRSPSVRGALAGSFPIWGRYAPMQYPNWATKFLADSLMIREESLAR
jgi:hypothetical protein